MKKDGQQETIHSGSSFDDFLEVEGIRNEVEGAAIKRVLAWQFEQAMIAQHKTKQSMAKELKTSRSQLDRLLDPANTAVSLETMTRAASVLGKRLVFEIQDRVPVRKTHAPRVGLTRSRTKVSVEAYSLQAARNPKLSDLPETVRTRTKLGERMAVRIVKK